MKTQLSLKPGFWANTPLPTELLACVAELTPSTWVSIPVQEWQRDATPNEEGWMFANETTGKPYYASTIQQDYLRPEGLRSGLGDGLVWHTFRHSYRALLDATGASLGVQQRLMRHADIGTTMNVYGGAHMNEKCEAHGKVVQMLLPPKEKAATAMAASQLNSLSPSRVLWG